MKKATITFEVTETKTEVIVVDTKGRVEKMDITDTKSEKSLKRLLKQLYEESVAKQVVDAIDINKWEQV